MAHSTCRSNQRPLSPLGRVEPQIDDLSGETGHKAVPPNRGPMGPAQVAPNAGFGAARPLEQGASGNQEHPDHEVQEIVRRRPPE
jgi:hypothetical protein